MGPSEDLAAVVKKTSGLDREAVNCLFWVRAVVPLWWMRLCYLCRRYVGLYAFKYDLQALAAF